MRRGRRAFTIAATAASLAFPIALAAPAVSAAGAGSAIELMRLDCAERVTDTSAAVRCEWSAPSAADAAGYRLWRYDPTTDRVRQVIFRTGDLGVTEYVDSAVRRAHRYTYVAQALNGDGRVVARSRAETVGVPGHRSVEVLRLACELGAGGDAVGCEWSAPGSSDADVVELWRSVDGGTRELVDAFRPSGPNAYRDPVPEGATTIAYAVLARDADGKIVARSRAQRVLVARTATEREPPADVAPVANVAPVTDPPASPAATVVPAPERPAETVPVTVPEEREQPERERGVDETPARDRPAEPERAGR